MPVPPWLAARAGAFTGTSHLYFAPPAIEQSCDSVLRVLPRVHGQLVELSYSWSRKGRPAEGLLVLHFSAERTRGSWTDSWHLADELMHCDGEPSVEGCVSVRGTYAVSPGPDWGWRIALTAVGEHDLRLEMFNIEPDGNEALAVQCDYARSSVPAGTLDLGAFSVSLAVSDLAASRDFYSALGFEVIGGDSGQGWLILRNGTTTLGLFHGMFEHNLLTFNPGWAADATALSRFTDVRAIQQALREADVEIATATDPEARGPASIVVVDPDGNPVLIDQHVPAPDPEG